MEGCPVKHDGALPTGAGSAGGDDAQCPVQHDSSQVFLQQSGVQPNNQGVQQQTGEQVAVDPRNNMPKVAEQKVWPGQSMPLSKHRQESVIPKGDFTPEHQNHAKDSSSWMYPSEQQFFNAMKRKGWQPREEDMRVVLSIHNYVNDTAWSEILKYEEMHMCDCDSPKLKRFMGRPKDLSPKARMRSLIGYSKPFDRHDWIVDRCGKEVRYIIDFYKGPPPRQESGQLVSMHLDARPALDSWDALADRVKLQFRETFKPFFPGTSSSSAASSQASASPK